MKRIAHLSDLHFGATDLDVTQALLDDLFMEEPDLVVVSGDLTQRARTREFVAARHFLDALPFPKIVVPGNHDIPLYDVGRRFLAPLARYKRHITPDLSPLHEDDDMVILGLNTARSLTFKHGRLSPLQMGGIHEHFCGTDGDRFKVLVTHHPFIPPEDDPTPPLVGGGPEALRILEACGADLLLAGHLHVPHSGDVREHHVTVERSILIAHAGTAFSTRIRGEPNSYNLITVEPPDVAVEVRAWDGDGFASWLLTRYRKEGDHWEREA